MSPVLLPVLLLAAEPSMLPLSDQLQLTHFGEEPPPANSGYGPSRRRRRMAELTAENTERIRIRVDYASLDEATAPRYSACFQVGSWYARGLAGPEPPADGVATCQGLSSDQDCWGKCSADDLIDATGRAQIIAVVDRVVEEVQELFSLRRGDAEDGDLISVRDEIEISSLTFDSSLGRYAGVYSRKGYPSEEACARDCSLVSGAAVSPDYCVAGVEADVVLSLTKPPLIPGVAGTGGSCASDSTGRPTWMVFAWIQAIVGMSGTTEELLARHRPLIMHEILHGLGFSNTKFRSATDSQGNQKGLLALGPVTDLDGDTDEVWYFTKGRAYELAQNYFGCTSNGSWDGLPLMGLPELGRASHWETRVMRDDVMSYGNTVHAVSSITLAAMEDLGWYRANYSAAQCMSWGYQQGCDYVTTRCGRGTDDLSKRVSDDAGQDECKGDATWDFPNAYLADKCEQGIDPCYQADSNVEAPFNKASFLCNAQCYTGPDRDGCTASPTSALETAGGGGISNYLAGVSWEQFLFFAVWLLAALFFFGCLRSLLCPAPGSRRVLVGTSVVFMLAGLVTVFLWAIALAKVDTIPQLELLSEQVSAFTGEGVMVALLVLGLLLFLVGSVTLVGVRMQSHKTMAAVFVIWLLLLLFQVVMSFLLCWWVYVLEDVPNETLATLQGKDDGRYEGELGAETLTNIEGFVCQLYQKCCRDPQLDMPMPTPTPSGGGDSVQPANRTCLYSHEGVGSDVEVTLADPSSPKFCPYVTGSDRRFAPPSGICHPLDSVFPLADCRANFCLSGPEGYYNFLNELVGFLRQYATAFAGLFACLVLVELVLLVNLWNIRRRFKAEAEQAAKTSTTTAGQGEYIVRNSHANVPPMPKDDIRRNIAV